MSWLVTSVASLFWVVFAQSGQIVVLRDIEYAKPSGVSLKLDVCQPKELAAPRPGIILTHGGGFRTDDKRALLDECQDFAKLGYVAATVNYRLAPTYPYPAQIDDVQYAVRWLRANAKTYMIDPNNMGSFGGSAGGYLATMLGVRDTKDPSLGLGTYSSRVQAVNDRFGAPMDTTDPAGIDPNNPYAELQQEIMEDYLHGYTVTPQLLEEISPVTYATSDDAPLLAVHSVNDQLAPILNSQKIVEALKNVGVWAKLEPFQGQGNAHGLANASSREKERVWNLQVAFFATHLPIGGSSPTPIPTSTPSPTPAPSGYWPGDIDRNGKVDIFDYNLLVENFGKTGTNAADIDGNGKVDIFDYNILVENFGKSQFSKNPFGVMIAGSGMNNQKKAEVSKTLGAVYYRPVAVFVDHWNGTCGECDATLAAGLKLILTVRNNGGGGTPTTAPTDQDGYKRVLGEIVKKYHPEVLVVENEENSQALFYSGTPGEYHAQLKAACDTAHGKGIRCTNGGLVSSLVVLLVYDNYRMSGDDQKAEEFLKRALSPDKYKSIKQAGAKIEPQIQRGKELLSGYRSSGADFVNFHWYQEDTQALVEAVDYLTKTSGLPAITNEVGQQKSESPAWVTSVMGKVVDLNLPYAVWFSIDTPDLGRSRALTDENGNLRPSGEAFAKFIRDNF